MARSGEAVFLGEGLQDSAVVRPVVRHAVGLEVLGLLGGLRQVGFPVPGSIILGGGEPCEIMLGKRRGDAQAERAQQLEGVSAMERLRRQRVSH